MCLSPKKLNFNVPICILLKTMCMYVCARPTAILFCIENVKVIVRHDEVIIFGPTLPQVKEFIPALQQQIENSQLSSIDPFSNSNSSVRLGHRYICGIYYIGMLRGSGNVLLLLLFQVRACCTRDRFKRY